MTNSADPDQLASSEANWSGSTLFVKIGHVGSAREGLKERIYFIWQQILSLIVAPFLKKKV